MAVERSSSEVDKIVGELEILCSEIPLDVWSKRFPTLRIPLFAYTKSPLLPVIDSGLVNGERVPLGNNTLRSVLARNGRILMELVHIESDDYISDQIYPDEVLGEANEHIYIEDYEEAKRKLEVLKQWANSYTRTD